MQKHHLIAFLLAAALIAALTAGCRKPVVHPTSSPPSSASPSSPSTTQAVAPTSEQPIAPEKNPPGDIPDSQVFITYTSQVGQYSLDTPEGWSRTENGGDVKFSDKFDGEQVNLSKSAVSPTIDNVRRDQIPALEKSGRAVKIQNVKTMAMPRGQSVIAVFYTSNSDPDPVTGKQIRIDNGTYYYYRQGTLAALTLWAPSGADNVDQWKRISESYRWL